MNLNDERNRWIQISNLIRENKANPRAYAESGGCDDVTIAAHLLWRFLTKQDTPRKFADLTIRELVNAVALNGERKF